MHIWNMLHAPRWKYRTQKIAILAPSDNFVGLYLRSWGMYRQSEKNLLKTLIPPPHVLIIWWTYGPLTAEIRWRVSGTPANFRGFRVLATLLHGTLVVGVSQTLRRWTVVATYIWQCDHQVRHWPTFKFCLSFFFFSSPNFSGWRFHVCHTSTHGVALVRI